MYFDREIGFYCMSCGYKFTVEEALTLIQKATLTSQLTHKSGKSKVKLFGLTITDRQLPKGSSKSANPKHVPSEVERSEMHS